MKKLRKAFVGYFLVLIFLASSWSLLLPKFFRVHDYTHAGRIAEMSRALTDGHFPVRWTQNFGYGYGMPLFEFYGPLPFYVGAAFFGIGTSVVFAIKMLYLIANAGTAWGGYKLGERLFGKIGGLITAAALTLAPYRAVNLFVRGALNEAWAIMFLPWIILGVIKTLHQEKRGWLMLTLSLVGLFLSHNITTMIFAPILALFVLGYIIWMFWSQAPQFFRLGRFRGLNFLRVGGQILGSGILAVGMSAFYLFPAFLERNLTQVEDIILATYFDYNLHFLYIRQFFFPNWGYGGSAWGVEDGISFFLGWGQWLGLILLFFVASWQTLVLIAKKRFKKGKLLSKKTLILGKTFLVIFLLSMFMTILKSKFAWDLVPLFKYIQFPWRWFSVGIVFLSLLLGAIVWFIPRKPLRAYLGLLLVVVIALGSIGYFRPESYLVRNDEYYYTDSFDIRVHLSPVLHDYISTQMATTPKIIPQNLVIPPHPDLPQLGEYEILADRVQEKLIRTRFTEETRLSLAVAHYPEWRAEIDRQRWTKETGEDGNIVLVVPPGEHLVTLQFKGTPIRNYSDWASAASWLLLFYLILPKKGWNLRKDT